jgi:REP element-mobilizing transposase RayT
MNGYFDHVHVLVALRPDERISDIVRLLKGESSNWMNKNSITKTKFFWQNEYYAISVSPGAVKSLKKYIDGQENHHRSLNFDKELKNISATLYKEKV